MRDPSEVLRTKKTYALVGATTDTIKYGYELFVTLNEASYRVYPINPRYEKIEGHQCYASLSELPEKPEVVIMALSPKNVEALLGSVMEQGTPILWLPPGSWSEAAVAKAKSAGLDVLYDVCPIGTLRKMQDHAQP